MPSMSWTFCSIFLWTEMSTRKYSLCSQFVAVQINTASGLCNSPENVLSENRSRRLLLPTPANSTVQHSEIYCSVTAFTRTNGADSQGPTVWGLHIHMHAVKPFLWVDRQLVKAQSLYRNSRHSTAYFLAAGASCHQTLFCLVNHWHHTTKAWQSLTKIWWFSNP